MLYWTDWSSTSAAIYRSSVVNPARETLVSGRLYWPNALTIDFSGKVIGKLGNAGIYVAIKCVA